MDGPKAAIRRSDSSMMAVGPGTPHSMSGIGQGGGGVGVSSGQTGGSVPPQHPQSMSGTGPTGPAGRERSAPTPTQSQGRGGGGGMTDDPPGILRDRGMTARKWNTDIPNILPHERVFPIQIGSELFRLSGASISSDAPSYFSQFFKCQLAQAAESDDAENATVRTLYIDRDPVTFADISRHLQGYHVQPKNGSHFVKLFADAQFYSLPRLISQLYEESIFISIGHRDFQIPRELFSDPGNSPNYFSLGFAVFFSTPTEVFPGLSREGLLRPPSIVPPSVPNRSADTFAEILHLLRGYPLHIKNEEHRAELLRDCRYFHLKGLEQKLIRHHISYNLARQKQEICLRLEDVRQSGISIGPPNFPTPAQMMSRSSGGSSSSGSSTPPFSGYINYARPFVDTQPYELVLEIGDECTRLHFTPSGSSPTTNSNLNLLKDVRAEFFGEGKKRISRLFEVVATKMGLGGTSQPLGLLMKNGKGGAGSQPASPGNTLLSEDQVKVYLEGETCVVLDGKERSTTTRTKRQQRQYVEISDDDDDDDENEEGTSDGRSSARSPPRKRRRGEGGDEFISGSGSGLRGGSDSGPHSGPTWNTEERERESWIIKTGQWRLRVQHKSGASKGPVECVLIAVKLDAWRSELGRNSKRGFLGG